MAKKTDDGERKPVETHRREQKTPAFLFAAAKAKFRWPYGKRLTASEYTKALEAAGNERLG